MGKWIAGFVVAAAAGLATGAGAQEPQRAPLFPQGECSGVLCSTIGGSQAPQNQPQKSLFREGECGGVLCNAIGGSQAPRHAEAPPACGGGLLCDIAPYGMGQPFVKPDEAMRRQAEAAAPASAPAGPAKVTRASSHHRKAKAHAETAARK